VRRSLVILGIAGIALGIAAAVAARSVSTAVPPAISRIVLKPKSTLALPELVDTPDLYLVVFDLEERSWRSITQQDAVIGDGLAFDLPEPPKPDAKEFSSRLVARVEVWDEDAPSLVNKDDLLDRFAIEGGVGAGQAYSVTADHRSEPASSAPLGLYAFAAVFGLAGLVALVRGIAVEVK
jgi:hypothetical protein